MKTWALLLVLALLVFGCSSEHGEDVVSIEVIDHRLAAPVVVRDRETISAIMAGYDKKVRELAKFPWEYIIKIRYRDGRVVEASVGHGCLRDSDGVSYRVAGNVAETLHRVIAEANGRQ